MSTVLLISDINTDGTFKFDYMQNTCVLALYAMSPDFDVMFLSSGFTHLASADEILNLAQRAKDAVWRLYSAAHEVEAEVTARPTVQAQKQIRQDRVALPAATSTESIFLQN